MSLLAILNILIINVAIWLAISYFWSFWTHKLFKPWAWLEMRKRKLLTSSVEKAERSFNDRVRLYSYFFALQQVTQTCVPGSFVLLGLEEGALIRLLRDQAPERDIFAAGPMEASKITLTRENCQGEVSEETVDIDFVPENEVRDILPEGGRNKVFKGRVADALPSVQGPIALAFIDCVEFDVVLASLQKVYPLMSPGGQIIVHSYNHDWEGIRRAVDTFVASIPESFVALPDMYGSIAIPISRRS